MCLIALAMIVGAMPSCSGNDDDKVQGEPVDIVRLDSILGDFATLDNSAAAKVFAEDSSLIVAQLQVMGADSADLAAVRELSSSLAVRMFAPQTRRLLPSLAHEQQALGNIIARADKQGINLPSRRYVATVWGRPESIVVNGDVVLIALNHYLGSGHEAYAGWPEYQRRLKDRRFLPYDMAEALLGIERPYAPKRKPMVLSRLLYEGAMAHAKMQLTDSASLADVLGVTDRELTDMAANRKFMYERLLSGDMLHSTDQAVMDQLFAPAPVCTLISPKAPGRAVRLLGYDIVTAWLEKHPQATLNDLLTPAFYDSESTFADSGYQI